MSWCDDNFAIAGDGWSGNPVPVPVPRRNLAFTTTSYWAFDRKLAGSANAQRALALYREALNAKFNGLVSYAVLNFYKVVEMRHQGRSAIKNWFRDIFRVLKDDKSAADHLKEFLDICGDKQPHIYIYESCRIAVAHGGKDSKSDPDDAHEIVRLHIAADIMWRLARHLISAEFQISDDPWSGD